MEFLTVSQAARHIGCSIAAVSYATEHGLLPFHYHGSIKFITKEAADQYKIHRPRVGRPRKISPISAK